MRWKYRAAILALATLGLAGAITPPALAAGATTYYVDSSPTSGCSDDGPGTNLARPFCSFEPLNQETLTAGDRVLLARGASWNEQLTLTGTGTSQSWIEIDAYGSGTDPKIIRNGAESERGIQLTDPSYWRISNIEVGNAGTGIHILFTKKMNHGLSFNNIFVHDIKGIHHGSGSGAADRIWNSAGIEITAVPLTLQESEYIVKGVDFVGIRGERNLDTISIDWFNGQNANKNENSPRAAMDVSMNRLSLTEGLRTGTGCDDGMRLTSIGNLRLINSRFDAQASCPSITGTAAVYAAGVTHSGIYNNIFSNVAQTDSPDQAGWDYECCFDNVEMSGNLFAGNAGAGLSFLGIHGPSTSSGAPGAWDYSLNHRVSANTFVGNGNGSIRRAGNDLVPQGTIIDNLYSEPYSNTFLYQDGGDYQGFAVKNNRAATGGDDVYHAAQDFSSTQGQRGWGYAHLTEPGSWSSLVFDPANSRWTIPGGGVPLITAFEMHPGTSAQSLVARSWEAPKAGFVNVRSRVLKSNVTGGDGVQASILKGGTTIVAPVTITGTDGSGVELNVDRLWVEAGDKLYFALGNNGGNQYDMTSWVPAIAYDAHSAEWDVAAISEDWVATDSATLAIGAEVVEVSTTAVGAGIASPTGLELPAASIRSITLGLRADANTSSMEFVFSQSGSTVVRGIPFSTYANKLHSEYVLDMRSFPEWNGEIDSIGIRTKDSASTFGIGYVRLGDYGETVLPPREDQPGTAVRWDFETDGDLEGWTLANHLVGEVRDGALELESVGNDPYFVSASGLAVDAGSSRYVRLSVRNGSGIPVQAQVFFALTSAPEFSGGRNVSFTIPPSSEFITLEVDMLKNVNWSGEVSRLRIDPMRAPGHVSFDWIEISQATSASEGPVAPAWDATKVYESGDRVAYDGATYVAQWWSRGERPGSTATGSWMEQGVPLPAIGAEMRAWTASWVYTGGETVAHNGHIWRASWWTRNQPPGEAHGPWQDLGAY